MAELPPRAALRALVAVADARLVAHAHVAEAHGAQPLHLVEGAAGGVAVGVVGEADLVEAPADDVDRRRAGVGVQAEGALQDVVGGARRHRDEAPAVGGPLGRDPPPLLVHVVAPLHEVVDVGARRPAGVGVVDVEVLLLAELPPAVRPLEDEAAQGGAGAALAVGLLVDLPPLAEEVAGLGDVVLAVPLRVPGVGAELGVDEGHAHLVADALEEVAAADPAVDVGAHDVHVGAGPGDDVEIVDVAVGQGHRVAVVEAADQGRPLPHQRVEVLRPRIVGLLGQVLDLEARPREPVVVLVAEEVHQHPPGLLVGLDRPLQVRQDRPPRGLVPVVGLRHEAAVHLEAVTPHQVVDGGHDAVVVVDVLHPAGRDLREQADGVDAHVAEHGHLGVEGLDDELVGLVPQGVAVVLPHGDVAPVHAEDHEVLAVDLKLPAPLVLDEDHLVRLRLRPGGGPGEQGREQEGGEESAARHRIAPTWPGPRGAFG